jgi:hypothetical protein
VDSVAFETRVTRLEEVNKVIARLDPSIKAQAFDVLRSYVAGDEKRPERSAGDSHGNSETPKSEPESNATGAAAFFTRFDHQKPSENALLLAAYHYLTFGIEPFSAEEMRSEASTVGLTIPSRIDKTYASAKRDGKALFQRVGAAQFRPTVHGEAYLKTTYQVKKGTAKRQVDATGNGHDN